MHVPFFDLCLVDGVWLHCVSLCLAYMVLLVLFGGTQIIILLCQIITSHGHMKSCMYTSLVYHSYTAIVFQLNVFI